MKNTALASVLAFSVLSCAAPAFAGEIIVGGWFIPGFNLGYVNNDGYSAYGDTSGMMFGSLINWSSTALLPIPKTLTFDSPVYGEQSVSYNIIDYIDFTPAGMFYQERNAAGEWLDVNIVYRGVSSFSFTDYATIAPPPPPIDPPPCMVNCGGDPPPIVVGAPEPSTWLMLLMGFCSLTLWRRPWLFPIRKRSST